MLLWHNDFRAIFWVAAIPAALAIALLFFGLKEPAAAITDKRTNPITRANLRLLGRGYWWVVGIGAVFTLARFSEAFLVLKAQQGGTPLALIPLVMVAMNLVYACSAYPFGKLSDRMSHKGMLKAGLLVLIAADVVLALSDHWAGVLFGVALWRAHGHDAGAVGCDGGAYRAGAPARHRVRHVQLGQRWRCCWRVSGPACCGSGSVPLPPLRRRDRLRGDAYRHAAGAVRRTAGRLTAVDRLRCCLQQLGHPLGFHRPAEQKTLADMETGFAQRLPLLLGFHSLGDDIDRQLLTENADAFHDRQDRRFGIHTLNEVAVQLNAVQRIIHDMAERGVTGAEVVQGDADAHLLEHLQCAQHVLRAVLVERVFGHLQFDQMMGYVELQQALQERFGVVVA